MERISESDVKLEEVLYKQQGKVEVYKAKLYRTGEYLCMKKIYVENVLDATSIQTECLTMAYFDHPNILKLRSASLGGYDREITHVIIFMDYFKEGDLDKNIIFRSQKKNYFTQDELLEYLKQLVDAYSYMQYKGTAHRDIKPQNIFIDNNGTIFKVGDLGSAVKKDINAGVTLTGTPLYLSPKLRDAFLKGNNSSSQAINHDVYKSDVFSLGLTFLYMASLIPVKDLCTLPDLQNKINKRINELSENYSVFKKLLAKMLAVEEEERLDFIGLKNILMKNQASFVINEENIIQNLMIAIQEGSYECEICKTLNKDEDLFILTNGIICKNCYIICETKAVPNYELYHYSSEITHLINKNTWTCECMKSFCRYCKGCHKNAGMSCLENSYELIQGYGESMFFCKQCLENGVQEFVYLRKNTYFICCQKMHYQCLVCGEQCNKSYHEACPILFSGIAPNI
ncbi:hypothetical protein SteCoe_14286 [Stentor coeruleus]|uniref:non-specific serine/threonine protein kinase n=1 Tax=Stentor coeruleus TaxID=5963 RepID=A0A1R2C6E2_9CILI|nr:hypothetical protein SteCoe_14286 [Stentor coeruleus]